MSIFEIIMAACMILFLVAAFFDGRREDWAGFRFALVLAMLCGIAGYLMHVHGEIQLVLEAVQ